MKFSKKMMMNFFALLVIILFINLPIVSAIEISDVRVESISDNSAQIKWNTDEPADSFLSYGTAKEQLATQGDASLVTEHKFSLSNLLANTKYYFAVKSNEVSADNSGNLFEFSTLPPDVTAPELVIKIPAVIQGNRLSLTGSTEIGATVNLYLDGLLTSSTIAESKSATEKTEAAEKVAENLDGTFTFSNVALINNKPTVIKVEVVDAAGNKVVAEGTTFADTNKPQLTLGSIPEILNVNNFELKGSFSEDCSFEIFVNEKSVAKEEGTTIQEEVHLEEGKNLIKIVFQDAAGWEAITEKEVYSDTRPPTVSFDFAKGKEYYQGRAKTDISGETEAGATVYLFVYRPLGYDFSPKFDKAWETVTANEKGEFVFTDVDLESQPIQLENLAPKEVPSGLQQETIFKIESLSTRDKYSYYVYVIAEDKSGKSAHQKKIVTVNTCYSADSDFLVNSLVQFQAPLRLNPTLLDEGRETFTAAFNLTYRGKGVSLVGEESFKIQNVQFELACTQGMMDDERTRLGCNIFPPVPRKTPNGDQTAWYLSDDLYSAEKFSENKEDFWNEFKKRRIVFPLKVKITYRENLGGGKWSETKTQISCNDLTYLVDIPVESEKMIPDFIAEEGLDAVEWTIDKIDLVLPYLEKAILVVGIGWVTSFLGRMVTRYSRMVTSKLEVYFTKGNSDGEKCPANQEKYYLESTIKHWIELESKAGGEFSAVGLREDWRDMEKSLDKLCPMTANLWKAEAVLDQTYRWTGDRILCRAVPAGWTSTKEKYEVDTVIMEQNQCTASSRGVPLQEIEDCGTLIKENENIAQRNEKAASLIKGGSFTCYRNNNFLYTVNPADQESALSGEGRVLKLELVHDFGLTLKQAELYAGQGNLLAYQPKNSDQFFIAQDKTCKDACQNRRKPGYRAYTERGVQNLDSQGKVGSYGCFREARDIKSGKDILIGATPNDLVTTKQFEAGYTKDCFVDLESKGGDYVPKAADQTTGTTGMLRCVCTLDEEETGKYVGVREAMKETAGGIAEDWVYRQDQIFAGSNHRFGTNYPNWRYYSGRDFSSAFGADALPDYLSATKQVATVSPNTQFLGAYQTICLSRIRAQLVTLKSILEGLRNCIQEAKVTGIRDAGVCKTIFTQQVCGLVYKAIAYFFSGCSPFSVDDSEKDALGGVGAIGEATFGSIGEAMQSSIDDVKRDYGNAKLNQYFAAGAQGLTESMCLAAFGYDWPLGTDFILDAAYSVPGKSSVLVTPANRELSTYDPHTGNAVYNYEIGAMVLPGCNIQSYNVYLKCVGPEDDPNKIQCGKQGCDCLRAQEESIYKNERSQPLTGGRAFNALQQNKFFSVPIPSPQKVNSHFRYDHVVVELKLDPSEKGNEELCFEDGFEDGVFYYPIFEVSPPGVGVCQVQLNGQYFCPEFVKMFGGGQGVYLQEPFMECYDSDTQTWKRCDTPNLFTKGKDIKVRANVVTDGGKYCLRYSTSGLSSAFGSAQEMQTGVMQPLPAGIAGSFKPEYFVDTVRPEMFTGAVTTIVLSGGNKGCESNLQFSGTLPGSDTLTFKYQVHGDKYRVFVQNVGVTVNNPYKIDGATLTKNGNDLLTSADVRAAQFRYQGFGFSNIIGAPATDGECIYQIRSAAGTGYAANTKAITVTAELFLAPVSGNCYNAVEAVKVSGMGTGMSVASKHRQTITLQLESAVSQAASTIHTNFVKKNYAAVISMTEGIINRKVADLEDAIAIYYRVAVYIAQGKESRVGWKEAVGKDVCYLVILFKTRDGGKLPLYPDEIKNSAEFQKIDQYLSEINTAGQCGVAWT